MDNKKLAEIIYCLAQYEGYNTSFLQTRKNLSSQPEKWEFANENDHYIFEDLLKAIQYAAKQDKLNVDVIKAINAQMDSGKTGQPEKPGTLRHNVEISVGDYIPPLTVTEAMVQREIDSVTHTDIASGWELYAKLAKLQAFDNGNKRTSLIAANLLTGALNKETDNYLIIPTDFRRSQFDTNLVYYYVADDWDDHLPDVEESLHQFVKFATELSLSQKQAQPRNKFEERLQRAEAAKRDLTPGLSENRTQGPKL
ncbi:Fic family protein [Lactococcus garvieae]|uniref:Fic family protein n=1 Tax=Lactococcus garvieae TaxID=1363 RepID=UPI0038545190